ncbi:MAG: hypothetical protein K0V04_12855 [Deltaproteobacteria bacterium]|nr:hypothetical protein [Deltaproteobacteria bacterium]
MLTKLIAIAVLGTLVGRVFFQPQLEGLGRWFRRFVDVTLIVITVVYAVQIIIMLTK